MARPEAVLLRALETTFEVPLDAIVVGDDPAHLDKQRAAVSLSGQLSIFRSLDPSFAQSVDLDDVGDYSADDRTGNGRQKFCHHNRRPVSKSSRISINSARVTIVSVGGRASRSSARFLRIRLSFVMK
ncbi:MAG: hypothetical protein WA776_10610 [Xanthobacteraceae bacterium]